MRADNEIKEINNKNSLNVGDRMHLMSAAGHRNGDDYRECVIVAKFSCHHRWIIHVDERESMA